MKYLSLFSGIGGFELGIQQAYDDISKAKRKQQGRFSQNCTNSNQSSLATKQPTCIGYSEIDKYAIQVYNKHFNHKNYGDITKINEKELPDFDLICGGFPCQSFSIAGKRMGFKDTRGNLFFEIARIIKEKQPRLLLLENVKGLLFHEQGRTFRTIISTLDELGYDCQWQVLNSKNFGVPQNRERVFIVGHLRGTSRPEVFPIGEANENSFKQTKKLPEPISNTLRTNYSNGKSNETYVGEGEEIKIRRLTPTECERLQGFPDDWTKEGLVKEDVINTDNALFKHMNGIKILETTDISDTQRYKMCGNAVTINVVKEIIKKIL